MIERLQHFVDWHRRRLLAKIRHLRYRVQWSGSLEDPLSIIRVDTNDISYKIVKSEVPQNTVGTYILPGEWDQNVLSSDHLYPNIRPNRDTLVPIEQFTYYTGVRDHYLNGIPWEETDLYEYLIERYENKKQIEEEIRQFERIYENVKKSGYMTQKELISKGKVASYESRSLPGHDEVCVAIGRQGEIYHMGKGNHRIAIAKVLDENQLPVRVLLRHEKWQQKRHEIYLKKDDYSASAFSHPDLKLIFDNNPCEADC